jgi:hypothetical protein
MVSGMKTLIVIALSALALAAVPAALAGNGGNNGNGDRIQKLQQRVDAFFDRCGTTSAGAPQRCVDVAHRAVERLQAIDAKVQQRLGNNPKLHALDEQLQKDIGRFQDWLGTSG